MDILYYINCFSPFSEANWREMWLSEKLRSTKTCHRVGGEWEQCTRTWKLGKTAITRDCYGFKERNLISIDFDLLMRVEDIARFGRLITNQLSRQPRSPRHLLSPNRLNTPPSRHTWNTSAIVHRAIRSASLNVATRWQWISCKSIQCLRLWSSMAARTRSTSPHHYTYLENYNIYDTPLIDFRATSVPTASQSLWHLHLGYALEYTQHQSLNYKMAREARESSFRRNVFSVFSVARSKCSGATVDSRDGVKNACVTRMSFIAPHMLLCNTRRVSEELKIMG